jgi:hypothetical protein
MAHPYVGWSCPSPLQRIICGKCAALGVARISKQMRVDHGFGVFDLRVDKTALDAQVCKNLGQFVGLFCIQGNIEGHGDKKVGGGTVTSVFGVPMQGTEGIQSLLLLQGQGQITLAVGNGSYFRPTVCAFKVAGIFVQPHMWKNLKQQRRGMSFSSSKHFIFLSDSTCYAGKNECGIKPHQFRMVPLTHGTPMRE